MIELCRTTGQKLLFEGKYECAVPAALAALKFAIQVYGLSSIELVPSYLILGEASIGKIHFTDLLYKPSTFQLLTIPVHTSGKYLTLTIELRFHVCDIS